MKSTIIFFARNDTRKAREGTKTQTRRLVKSSEPIESLVTFDGRHAQFTIRGLRPLVLKCPYGTVGDRLMVGHDVLALEITEVRVQRLQEITAEDCKAEGVECNCEGGFDEGVAFGNFVLLWDAIHGPGAWETNPFVWALTYRKAQP